MSDTSASSRLKAPAWIAQPGRMWNTTSAFIDTPYLDSQSNGLTVLIDRMKEQELFAHVNLVKGERSHLAELASTLL